MTEFDAETVQVQTAAALDRVSQAGAVREYALYVGLDVHKETIAVAVANPGRDEPTYRNEIANQPAAFPAGRVPHLLPIIRTMA